MGDLCKKHSIEEIEKALQSFESNPAMPSNIFDNSNTDEDMAASSGDEIEVVQANIYKYHGEAVDSLDKQVEEGILKFEYRNEDPLDDDIIEIDVIDKSSNSRSKTETVTLDDDSSDEEEQETEEEEDKVLTCEDCGCFVKQSNLFDHREEKHPRKNRTIKQFSDGNFFMLAD